MTEIHKSGPVAVLTMQGKLVLGASSNEFRATVEELLKTGNQLFVLNLKDVPYADSAGIGALAYNFSNVKAAGGQIAVAEVQPAVRDVMEVTNLSSLIPMFATEIEAVRSLSMN